MKKILALSALVTTLVAAAPAAATTYLLNRTIGVGSAIGSITTDNTLGALSTANITAFSITVNDGSTSFTITNLNGQVGIVGSALTATATGLFYNFSATGTNYALFQNPTLGSSINYYCLQTSGCYSPVNTPGEGLRVQGALLNNALTGNLLIAGTGATPAVPEVATWAMMILGFGMAGASLRYRRRATKIAYA